VLPKSRVHGPDGAVQLQPEPWIDVAVSPLAGIVSDIPSLRLIVQNQNHNAPVKQIAAAGQVYFDFAMVERVRGVATLARQISPARVVFGSHFPLFYLESASLKMREAGLSDADFRAISEGNARRLLDGK